MRTKALCRGLAAAALAGAMGRGWAAAPRAAGDAAAAQPDLAVTDLVDTSLYPDRTRLPQADTATLRGWQPGFGPQALRPAGSGYLTGQALSILRQADAQAAAFAEAGGAGGEAASRPQLHRGGGEIVRGAGRGDSAAAMRGENRYESTARGGAPSRDTRAIQDTGAIGARDTASPYGNGVAADTGGTGKARRAKDAGRQRSGSGPVRADSASRGQDQAPREIEGEMD